MPHHHPEVPKAQPSELARVSRWTRLRRFFAREVTVLLVPHSTLSPWRARATLSFIVFLAGGWSLLTVSAGYILGRNTDYWLTKADNEVLRMKMAYFEDEFSKSRKLLAQTRDTDRQMRELLRMNSRRAIIQDDLSGVGGPAPGELHSFAPVFSRIEEGLSQPEFHREARDLEDQTQRRLASFQEISWYIASQRSLYRAVPDIWPAPGRITSGFGYRLSPFGGDETGEFHSGVDIANAPETPILATADGVVRYEGWQGGYGRVVVLDHGFGYSTLYGHTSHAAVHTGQRVSRGQVIAYMGTTGRSTGEHVHYEVWRDGRPVDPMPYLQGKAVLPRGFLVEDSESE